MQNLLFIDDDTDLLFSNKKYFSKEGYNVEVAESPKAGLVLLKTYTPDCIILDVMLPQMSGFELYKEIRNRSQAPVIFLSGRSGEEDRVKGLLLGGADYIVKPYSLRELSARIAVQIRKSTTDKSSSLLSFPPLTIDIIAHKVYHLDTEIPLSRMEYQLLSLLVATPNETVSFEDIGEKVWGGFTQPDRRTIMVVVSRLRKKLEDYAGQENAIESSWAKGYKFVGERRRLV